MPSEQGSNMANAETELTVAEAYEIADRFAQASARILDFRVNTGNLSGDQADALLKVAAALVDLAVAIVSKNVQGVVAAAKTVADASKDDKGGKDGTKGGKDGN